MKTITKLLFPKFEEESQNQECFKDLSRYLDSIRSIKDYFLKIYNDNRLESALKIRMWQEEVSKYQPTWPAEVNPEAMGVLIQNPENYEIPTHKQIQNH